MTDTVYDCSFVAFSNGNLAGRRRGNVFDRRLTKIEEFLSGARVAWYNNKLFKEYSDHIRVYRNDLIEAFLRQLVDAGKLAKRSTLSRTHYSKLRRIRWPTHDQHLLAAALEATMCTIFVTEATLSNRAAAVNREFSVSVVRIA